MDGRKPVSPRLRPGPRKKLRKPFALSRFFPLIKKGVLLAFLLALIGGGYFLWHERWFHRQWDHGLGMVYERLSALGFRIEDVQVEGRSLTSSQEILHILGVHRGDFIFSVSLPQVQKELEALPWVRSASLQRRLPNVLYVRLAERHPVALWQKQGKRYLVDDQGKVLESATATSFPHLIVLTGEGAPENVRFLMEALVSFPEIASQVTGALFISQRRWDLIVNHKLRVKLAEVDLKQSLSTFSKLLEEHRINNRSILGIDLRFRDRIYVQFPHDLVELKKPSAKDT